MYQHYYEPCVFSNTLLAELYYEMPVRDIDLFEFADEMLHIAMDINFTENEWKASVAPIRDYSFANWVLELDFECLFPNWLRESILRRNSNSLKCHFIDEQNRFNAKDHSNFFDKVDKLSKQEALSVVFVGHNYWKGHTTIRSRIEEVINS